MQEPVPAADGIKIVQDALEHADISTTLNTNAHTDPEVVVAHMEAQAQERLKRKMQRSGSKTERGAGTVKCRLSRHLSKEAKSQLTPVLP
jgi:hypothetical protein